jgi:D-alanyl-D-alanine dipeptidase
MILLSDIVDARFSYALRTEPMVCLRGLDPRIAIDETRSQISSTSVHFCYARLGLARRLIAALEGLPPGFGFIVKEAYRPLARQQASWEEAGRKLLGNDPGLGAAELRRLVSAYVAPPAVAGHPTGGALDVTLSLDGRELFMGTAFNDEPGESGGRSFLDAEDIGREARGYRSILASSLGAAGFVNYPTEWWHWSFGDKYWAFLGERRVLYAPVLEVKGEDRALHAALRGVGVGTSPRRSWLR